MRYIHYIFFDVKGFPDGGSLKCSGGRLRLTMPSRCGTKDRVKKHERLGLPDAIALGRKQGNHTPSPSASTAKEKDLGVRFRGIASAEPLADIANSFFGITKRSISIELRLKINGKIYDWSIWDV